MLLLVGMNYTDDGMARSIVNLGLIAGDIVPSEIARKYCELYDEVYTIKFDNNYQELINEIVTKGCRLGF